MIKEKGIQSELKEMPQRDNFFSVIESLLFVSGEAMKLKDISDILQCSPSFTKGILKEMTKAYEEANRGIRLININDEYQFVTKPENSEFVQKILKTNTKQSLSQASLEILAIIAYKQPITRIDIDEIRGVKSDSAISRLLEKNLIKESGRLDVPGRPILYSTTDEFLMHFELSNIGQLPSLDDILDKYLDDEVQDTNEVKYEELKE